MCNPDLHFMVGAAVASCAIIGTEIMVIGLGGSVCVRLAKWAVREMRSAWEGKP